MPLMLALCLLIAVMTPVCCAAAGATPDQLTPELDKNFNVDLATTLIIIFCSAFIVFLLVILFILAKRNLRK